MAPATGTTSAPAQSAQTDSLEAAHAELLADRDLQFEMPAMEPPEPPGWLQPLAEFLQAIGPFMVYIFWGGVALTVAALLYLIGSEILRRMPDRAQRAAAPEPATPEYRPAPARAQVLLAEADRLAAEGKYSEAARVLLHRSIDDFEQAFSLSIGPGQTSREIARLKQLSDEGRRVFGLIARAVETSLFGGRALGADDFARCREAYASFALPGARR